MVEEYQAGKMRAGSATLLTALKHMRTETDLKKVQDDNVQRTVYVTLLLFEAAN
jgi:hypothetical protein